MRKKLILLMTLVATLTAGCVQADLKLDVKDDGSGTYTALIAVNAQLFQQLGGLSALDPDAEPTSSSADICQQMIDDAQEETPPAGGKVEPYKKGDFCGVKISAPFANIEEGLALFNESSDSGGATLEDVTLEKQGNGWVFQAEWNPGDTSDATTGADADMAKQFLQGFSFVVRMKLPGGQVDQNADLIEDDGTMVWNLDPATERTLTAKTDANAPLVKSGAKTDAGKNVAASGSAAPGGSGSGGDDSGSKTWLYVVIGLVVLAAIAAVVLMKRNKAKTAPAMAGMSGMPGGPMDSGSMMSGPPTGAPPMGAPTPGAPMAPPASSAAAPTPQAAATEPQWDAARNAYIQYDAVNSRWMQYDQTAGAWKQIE